MTLNTATVALHTAPTTIKQFLLHFLFHRKERKGHPNSELSYDEGLAIVRKFLNFASTRTVDELQMFTNNKVPTPSWVLKETITIPDHLTLEAAKLLQSQLNLDPNGIQAVGGDQWWQVRGRPLTGEWIEMKRDKLRRGEAPAEKVLLYVHGGAHFFSSLETHRYQIQRHARKLNARAFGLSYRLAPQYPFPCSLQDLIATYLYLLNPPTDPSSPSYSADFTTGLKPSQIILSGDSSGGGLILAFLCLLRDQGMELPAGAVLISPWVDLSHSFPSVGEDDKGDYIPSYGFHYRPGIAWPPAKGDPVKVIDESGNPILIDEQIQMYCPNTLLDHPFVSPVNQGSLGGLPPLLILGGSAELLRDEIVYIAHKAASPSHQYPPSTSVLQKYPHQQNCLDKNYAPTLVQLCIYDDAAHVTPTLSITQPAKYMYRACANFGLWALTAAKMKEKRTAAKDANHQHHHHHNHAEYPTRQPSGSESMQTMQSNVSTGKYGSEQSLTDSKLGSTGLPTNSNEGAVLGTSNGDNTFYRTKDLVKMKAKEKLTKKHHSNSSTPPSEPVLKPEDTALANDASHDSLAIDSEDEEESEEEEEDENDSNSDSFTGSEEGEEENSAPVGLTVKKSSKVVSVTGHLPPFESHMIRERVTFNGIVRPMEPASDIAALQMNPDAIGVPFGVPVNKWLTRRALWDTKYAKDLAKFRQIRTQDRIEAEQGGFLTRQLQNDRPPYGCLASWHSQEYASQAGESVDTIKKNKGVAIALWAKLSAAPDEEHAGEDTGVKEAKEKLREEGKPVPQIGNGET